MILRPPRYTLSSSSAASDVYKRQEAGYRDALERHFAVYKIFMSEREKLKESHDMDSV